MEEGAWPWGGLKGGRGKGGCLSSEAVAAKAAGAGKGKACVVWQVAEGGLHEGLRGGVEGRIGFHAYWWGEGGLHAGPGGGVEGGVGLHAWW